MIKSYFKLLRFLKDHNKLFIVSVFIMLMASFLEIFQLTLLVPMLDVVFGKRDIEIPNNLPGFIERLIERVNELPPNMETLYLLVGIFLVAMLLKNISIFAYQHLMCDMSQRILRDVRYLLFEKIQSLSLNYFSKKRTGELISRITNDVQHIDNAISYAFVDLFRQTFMILLCVTMAFSLDVKAALVIFIVFPVIGYPMSRIGKILKKLSHGAQEKMADITSLLIETISGIKVVKAFCTKAIELKRFKGQNHSFYKIRMKSIKRLILISPMTDIIGAVFGSLLIMWFGPKLINSEMSLGVFVLFFGMVMSIISPIKKLGNVNAIIQQSLAASERIYEVLETEPSVKQIDNPHILEELKESIAFEDVHFQYDEGDEIVLKGINLKINKGELVAIVGPTGTGKTTLVNLIPRFYDPIKGKITFDGHNLRNVKTESLRKQIGMVTQESILFNDSVRANIAYGRQDATQEEIEEAAKKAYAHRFITKMPQGYDTVIGDRGFRLSGGEKQRICIARAILRNPPIFILDEATSQLDSESEKFIQEALDRLMENCTVIAIAHRLSTIQKADKIVVLDQGKVIGLGPHSELIETCPLYKKLHSMQFQV
ncbi:MAG: ABC transporter ATP-binding protein [Candidatus Omnitrophica bacterium]|nr:ABC transporter ATP-binding protein [Candidatus Omnitrophota bacterium]